MAEEPRGKCGMCTDIIISTKVHDEACFYHKRAHNFGKHQNTLHGYIPCFLPSPNSAKVHFDLDVSATWTPSPQKSSGFPAATYKVDHICSFKNTNTQQLLKKNEENNLQHCSGWRFPSFHSIPVPTKVPGADNGGIGLHQVAHRRDHPVVPDI